MTATQLVAVLGRGVVPPDTPIITADDFGLTRGDGCFDATRVVTGVDGESIVENLDLHLDRLERSADGLDLPVPDRAAWTALVEQAVASWAVPGEAVLKLVLTRGRELSPGPSTGVVTITPFTAGKARQGIRVASLDRGTQADAYVQASWLLGGVKSLSYAIIMAAKREAVSRGADDALFVTPDEVVLEGANSAIVWANAGVLYTTTREGTGVLASITQELAFAGAAAEGMPTAYTLGALTDIESADGGAWLLSSIRGVAPIVELDGLALHPDERLTARLNAWTGFDKPLPQPPEHALQQ